MLGEAYGAVAGADRRISPLWTSRIARVNHIDEAGARLTAISTRQSADNMPMASAGRVMGDQKIHSRNVQSTGEGTAS